MKDGLLAPVYGQFCVREPPTVLSGLSSRARGMDRAVANVRTQARLRIYAQPFVLELAVADERMSCAMVGRQGCAQATVPGLIVAPAS